MKQTTHAVKHQRPAQARRLGTGPVKDWTALLLAALAPPISLAAVVLLSRGYRQRRHASRALELPAGETPHG